MFLRKLSRPMASRVACAALVLMLFAVAIPNVEAASANAPAGTIRGAARYIWEGEDWAINEVFLVETTTIIRVDYDSVTEVATGVITEVHILRNLATGEISSSRVVFEVDQLFDVDSHSAVVLATDQTTGATWVGRIIDGAATNQSDELSLAEIGIPGHEFLDVRGVFLIEHGNYKVDL